MDLQIGRFSAILGLFSPGKGESGLGKLPAQALFMEALQEFFGVPRHVLIATKEPLDGEAQRLAFVLRDSFKFFHLPVPDRKEKRLAIFSDIKLRLRKCLLPEENAERVLGTLRSFGGGGLCQHAFS